MDMSLVSVIDTRVLRKNNLYLSKSTVILDDSPWKMFDLFQTTNEIFEFTKLYSYDVPDWQKNVALKDREYASIYLRADNSDKHYKRKTYDLLAYIGDLGGIHQLIWLIGGLLVGFIIERKFNLSLVKELYKVQKYSVDQSEYYKTGAGKLDNKEHHFVEVPDESSNHEDLSQDLKISNNHGDKESASL